MPATLTQRDLQILKLLGLGQPTKAIAAELGLSDKTIEYHIGGPGNPRSLYAKLGKRSRADLIRFAIENHLVSPGETPMTDKPKPAPVTALAVTPKTTSDLAGLLLHAAGQAANGTADVLQINALCQCSDAVIKLAHLQLLASERAKDVPWLRP